MLIMSVGNSLNHIRNMAFIKFASGIIFMVCLVFSQSSSSKNKATRINEASILETLLALVSQGSSCSSKVNNSCCTNGDCCNDYGYSYCCCDQVCHEPMYNDCCHDIIDVQCFPSWAPNNCSAAGYTGGCCDSGNCFVAAGDCYCDASCHLNGNCCPDIANIGCTAPSTCSAAGYTGGCCDSGNCFVAAGNCYCNASCHLNGNCCPDIADIGCAAPNNCSAAGYTGGCCDSGNCFVAAGNCYCNASCHLNRNCCPDIDDIGCAAPTNCTSAGFSGGCCDETYTRCSIRTTGRTPPCSCNQDCYSNQDFDGSNLCCEDIKDIHCYPRNCNEAGMTNCIPNDANDCSLRTSQNGSLCYCNEGCREYGSSSCCQQDEGLDFKARAERLRMQLLRMRMIIAQLQQNMENLEKSKYEVEKSEDGSNKETWQHNDQGVSKGSYSLHFNRLYKNDGRLGIVENSGGDLHQERRRRHMLYLRFMQMMLDRQQK